MSELDLSLRVNIDEAVNFAYDAVSKDLGYSLDMVHRTNTCMVMTEGIVRYLKLLHGISNTYKDRREGWQVNVHEYPVIVLDSGEDYVVDPTWQQFLSPDYHDPLLPRAIMGTRDEVVEAIGKTELGIDVLQLWLPVEEFERPKDVMARHPSSGIKRAA